MFPELVAFLGVDKTMDFVRVFGGLMIKCPTYKTLRQYTRELDIYNTLREDCSGGRRLGLEEGLAEKYGIRPAFVRSIYKRMCRRVRELERSEDAGGPLLVRVTDQRNVKNLCR